MNALKITVLFLFFSIKTLSAQNCHNYMPAQLGTTWQITNFNKKGILHSSINAKLVSLKTTDSTGFEAVVEQVFLNKKEEETGANAYRFRCKNNALFIDLLGILPPQILGAYQNMELATVGKQVEFGDSLKIGQILPDETVEMQAKSGSSIIAKPTFLLTKREVVGTETVTTMAGSFDCLKINYDLESRFGTVIVKRKCAVWLAKNVGMVKSETFKKGKLEGSQQLTAFRGF